jgi:hypothetical protein
LINREHKDRLFRLIFGEEKNKRNLLVLYNAINGTEYDDVSLFQLMTIDDCIYMGMKNDIGLLIDFWLTLYEQQSTWNPNTPVRGMFYFSGMYEKYIALNKLNTYGSKLIKLPTPQYIVFYNGMDERMDGKDELGDIEKAVNKAVDECIKEGVLADFLIGHKAEVMDVCLTEYDEMATINAFKEEAVDDVLRLQKFLLDNNRIDDLRRTTYDKEYRDLLISKLPHDEN